MERSIDRYKFKSPMTGRNHPETSYEAAEKASDAAASLRRRVFAFISCCGEEGATAHEVHEYFQLDKNSTSPRITELKQAGFIIDSGRRRASENCGRSIVWVDSNVAKKEEALF